MKKEGFQLKREEGTIINGVRWTPDVLSEKKIIIQIAHGMAEHIQRYERFAQALTREGWIVYGNDHRGHGKTAGDEKNLGFFSNSDGWHKITDDLYIVTEKIKNDYPEAQIILFGHSMGSLISRCYGAIYGKSIDGLILSGTAGNPGILGKIGIKMAKIEMKRIGKHRRSSFMDRMCFGGFNRKVQKLRTKFDWLSTDEKEVDKYINDPYCGQIFTASAFYDLLTGIKEANDMKTISNTPSTLPIYFFSGAMDPVGGYGKGVKECYEKYKQAGSHDVTLKLYKDGRHEMLNEINRNEVYEDVIQWIRDRFITINGHG